MRLENGKLKVKSSCEACIHVNTCKFYDKANTLFRSNEFYEMNTYLEHNNNLKSWSENKTCEHYVPLVFNKNLMEREVLKNKSYVIYGNNWHNLVRQYFIDNFYEKYKIIIDREFEYQKEKHPSTVTELVKDLGFIFQISSGGTPLTFTLTLEKEGVSEKITVMDILNYYVYERKI